MIDHPYFQSIATRFRSPRSKMLGGLSTCWISPITRLTILCVMAPAFSGCAVFEGRFARSQPPMESMPAMVAMPATVSATVPSSAHEFAWLPPPPQPASPGSPLHGQPVQHAPPPVCRPVPPPSSLASGGIEPAFFPADAPVLPMPVTQECLDLRALEQSLLERSNAIEQRLGQRIEALEAELQQSRAEALTLKSQLEQAAEQTAALEREVATASREVERINAMFLEQQAQDLESLEKLTNMLRILLVRPELAQQAASAQKEAR